MTVTHLASESHLFKDDENDSARWLTHLKAALGLELNHRILGLYQQVCSSPPLNGWREEFYNCRDKSVTDWQLLWNLRLSNRPRLTFTRLALCGVAERKRFSGKILTFTACRSRALASEKNGLPFHFYSCDIFTRLFGIYLHTVATFDPVK